jgi:hypothetical protein
MTSDELDLALRWYARRRPFHAFLIEFASGNQEHVGHPEAVDTKRGLYVLRLKDGGYSVFAAHSVTRLVDEPVTDVSL